MCASVARKGLLASFKANNRLRIILFLFGLGFSLAPGVPAQGPLIQSFARNGTLSFEFAQVPGVCTLERAPDPRGPWTPLRNVFSTTPNGVMEFRATANSFYRLLSVDVPPNAQGWTHLLESYGLLGTVAGHGDFSADGLNNWLPEYEGALAVEANLSRPHFAMADNAGHIYIADKDSHSILKVTSDGTIHTIAGTHEGGFNGDGPAPATTLQLNFPNGEWVRGDGTIYILDTGNGKVRRVDPDGTMRTLFTVKGGISTGRGLWVKDDESVAYFAAGTDLMRWTPAGLKTLNNNFVEIGNLIVDPKGQLIVTDRGANKVYKVDITGSNVGSRSRIAGDGTTNPTQDGAIALETGLPEVRGIWPVPIGGYLLATHAGSQVLYLDAAGIIHVFVDGLPGGLHDGDGQYFHSEGPKISEVRSVSMDARGRIIITENDAGYVRVVDFLRLSP